MRNIIPATRRDFAAAMGSGITARVLLALSTLLLLNQTLTSLPPDKAAAFFTLFSISQVAAYLGTCGMHAVLLRRKRRTQASRNSFFVPFSLFAFATAVVFSGSIIALMNTASHSFEFNLHEGILASLYSGTAASRTILIEQLRLSGRSTLAPWFDNTLIITTTSIGLVLFPSTSTVAFLIMLITSTILFAIGATLTGRPFRFSIKMLKLRVYASAVIQGFPIVASGLSSGYSREILIWSAAIFGAPADVNALTVILRLFDLSNLPATAAYGYLNPYIANFHRLRRTDPAASSAMLQRFRSVNLVISFFVTFGLIAYLYLAPVIFSSLFPLEHPKVAAALTLTLLFSRLAVALIGNPYYYYMFWGPGKYVSWLAAFFFLINFPIIMLAYSAAGLIPATLTFTALFLLRATVEWKLLQMQVGIRLRDLSAVFGLTDLFMGRANGKSIF